MYEYYVLDYRRGGALTPPTRHTDPGVEPGAAVSAGLTDRAAPAPFPE